MTFFGVKEIADADGPGLSRTTLSVADTTYKELGRSAAPEVGRAIATPVRLVLPMLPQLEEPGPACEKEYKEKRLIPIGGVGVGV